MKTEVFVQRTKVTATPDRLESWHLRPGAFQRLTPPWLNVRVLETEGDPPAPGSRVTLQIPMGPFRKRWVFEHRARDHGNGFVDVQQAGPFSSWEHTHRFDSDGNGGAVLEDHIEYALPAGPLGRAVAGKAIRRHLERMFAYRHDITAGDLLRKESTPRTIAITGASGLVGSTLVPFLNTSGHRTYRVRRDGSRFLLSTVDGVDAFVHLAGESIADGRWTRAKKDRIRNSRIDGTRQVAEHLASLENPPEVFVCASAIGHYGDRGDELLDESSRPGSGFLPEVCQAWEEAVAPARERGIRVVNLRLGVVLSPAGGALAKMLTPFRLGLGGRLGSGRQYFSWISIDDAAGAILHAIEDAALKGPVNAVAPEPVTNREMTKTLGRVLRRPTILAMPGFAARLAFGEVADDLLLASTRVVPKRLHESGYRFRDPSLEGALRRLLGR